MTRPQTVSVLWFKRDFRFQDHLPLLRALEAPHPILLVTLYEPSLFELPQYNERHERFIADCVDDLNGQLGAHRLFWIQSEAVEFFAELARHVHIDGVYSHQETGIKHTYDRDLELARFFAENGIAWHEFPANGVQRGLRNRQNWLPRWYAHAEQAPLYTPLETLRPRLAPLPFAARLHENRPPAHPYFQRGGESRAHRVLHSFLSDRIQAYARSISKPKESRRGCSRISPHLAWGTLSVRQVYHALQAGEPTGGKRNRRAFADRLRWQAHFIQKFESEDHYEFVPINRGYSEIDQSKPWNEDHFTAWVQGRTGVPLVDACMRCVAATGYLNFRMRAMVTSFYSQYLWLPWKPGADYLAGQFTDFEPGIHYAQFQMQSGYTGVNTIRIYNPVKQSKDHDPTGAFIKEWVPELCELPEAYIHEPWNVPPLERMLLGDVFASYPATPIVPLEKARKRASDIIYGHKKSAEVRTESKRILEKHVNPGPRRS